MLRALSATTRHRVHHILVPASPKAHSRDVSGRTAAARRRPRNTSAEGNVPARSGASRRPMRRFAPPSSTPPPTPTRVCVPAEGVSARQLGALANADAMRVFRAAAAIEPEVRDEHALLPPEVVELLAEQLQLNVALELQQPLFRARARDSAQDKGVRRRMPVVTVMGHVDHGKTSLLDALRGGDVAAHEAGGITQSIGAFEVPVADADADAGAGDGGQFATFIDTPGHAAFSTMRAFGAVATDVVVLVVAADDGVMPQTVEAVKHARAAGVPLVVAVNKCDKQGADPDRVRYQLLELVALNTEQLGGDVQCVEVSAKAGTNLDALMESILLQAELLDLGGDPKSPTEMICIESRRDRALGDIATVVVRAGTVRVGDLVVFQSYSATSGDLYGRVRSLVGMDAEFANEVGPGKAVGIVGMRAPVPPGSMCIVVQSEKEAKKMSYAMLAQNERAVATIELARVREQSAAEKAAAAKIAAGDDVVDGDEMGEENVVADGVEEDGDEDAGPKGMINVLIKGDVQGSADAVALCLSKLATKRYGVRVLAARVGDVNDSDLALAAATAKVKGNTDDALIVAFNVRASGPTMRKALKAGVDVVQHKLIYHLEDEVKARIEEHVRLWETTEKSLGKAQVVRVFNDGAIGGCSIDDGTIAIGTQGRVLRFPVDKSSESGTEREIVYAGTIGSIKHFSKDIRVANKGTECGIGFVDWAGFMPGDVVESVEIVKGTGR